MTSLILEVELDLPLDDVDIARLDAYLTAGLSEVEAATQTARDMLGGLGATVQRAQAVSE